MKIDDFIAPMEKDFEAFKKCFVKQLNLIYVDINEIRWLNVKKRGKIGQQIKNNISAHDFVLKIFFIF